MAFTDAHNYEYMCIAGSLNQ
eukprot:COSAG02_NODE_29978_length_559_cov_1.186957_1_plen_20_part_01